MRPTVLPPEGRMMMAATMDVQLNVACELQVGPGIPHIHKF
jgi:hypothetical protein